MFSLYKTIHPPTGIDNSVFCNFVNSKEQNLITSSANKLHIYKFNNYNSSSDSIINNNKLKLELVETFYLYGTISAIKACRYGAMTKDALIIAFSDAKLSIVEYDNFSGDLNSLSIHYFEDELEREGAHYNIYPPILKVDPNMRCACMLIYGFKLVVIPFNILQENNSNNNLFSKEQEIDSKQEQSNSFSYQTSNSSSNLKSDQFNNTNINNMNQNKNISNSNTSLSSYTIDLRKLDNWLEMRIIDIEFLYGYYEPTLFILCESNMTWVGRYAVKKDTCNSVALSLNLNQKTHPVIWPVDKLPSDCLKCYAVPAPIGGVLIFAVNSLIYINQSVPSYAVSLNSLATRTSHYPFRTNLEHIKITLDSSQAIFITQDRLCVSLKGGELYIITLITDSESLRSVQSFHIEKCASSVISTCLTKCFENYLFVGSRLGNSVLLKYLSSNKNTNYTTTIKNNYLNSSILTHDNNSQTSNNENNNSFEDLSQFNNNKANNLKSDEIDLDDMNSNDDIDQLMEITQNNQDIEKENTSQIQKIEENQNQQNIQNMYSFEICDVLLNIAPCGHSIIGETVGDYSEYASNNDTNSLQMNLIDLITSSGYTKNGSISVLQRSLRPDLIATFQIQDIIDMWSVNLNITPDNPDDFVDDNSITYLFLSKIDSTVILQIGSEITEIDKETSVFSTKEATLYCASMCTSKYLLQITTSFAYIYNSISVDSNKEIKLVNSIDLLDFIIDSKIKQVSVLDLYVGILTEKGSLFLFYFDSKNLTLNLFDKVTSIKENVSCFSLYEDNSHLFSSQLNINNLRTNSVLNNSNNDQNISSFQNEEKRYNSFSRAVNSSFKFNFDSKMDLNDIDDEDELLYGDSGKTSNSLKEQNYNDHINRLLTEKTSQFTTQSNSNQLNKQFSSATIENAPSPDVVTSNKKFFWLFTVTIDGTLLIYNIKSEPNLDTELILSYPRFNLAPKTIVTFNNLFENQATSVEQLSVPSTPSLLNSTTSTNVTEILTISCGVEKNKPFLIVRIDEDLIIYEAFLTHSKNYQTNSQIKDQLNFKRISHEIIIRDKRSKNKKATFNANKLNTNPLSTLNIGQLNKLDREKFKNRVKSVPCLREFDNLAGGLNGFAVIGSSLSSYLVFYCSRSGLTPHPLWLDSNLPIISFVPFKNSSITLSGFIYINRNFDVRICTLPIDDCNGKLQIYYDSTWILKKIQIRQTVNFLCYHEESKTYAVCYTQTEQTNKLMQLGDEDKEVAEFNKDENFIYPSKSQFFIQLYTPLEWEALPLGKYQLLEWEHVSSLKIVHLPYEGHSSGIRSYLAASTINCYSEDVNSRGRIILLDIIETVPEPDKPLTNTKIKIIMEKEQKGPVTCLESVNAHLVGCVGQKIFIWEYKNNELIGKAFIDTHFYVHKMITLKNFVLVADLHKSISLIRFQQEYTKLSFVAKDKHTIDTYACEYLVDNSNLGFVATDSEKNISVYMYQSESHDNQGGHWLIRKAEFNVGSHINSMFRLKCRVNDPSLNKRSSLADKRQVTYCTNLDGGIGYLLPISEKTFRRLFILQNAIIVMKSHYAGLNPKSYRIWKGKRKELSNPQKNILDGDLLFEYFNFSYTDRNDIAKKIKTNTEQLLDDLTEIFQLTCHF